MPLATETTTRKPLSGTELLKIILSDAESILSRSGFLTPHIAYGRVSYEIRITMHMDNPAWPRSAEIVSSRARSDSQIAAAPELAAIESTLPLPDASPQATLASSERHREIASPNAARVEHGMPVTILRRGNDSQTIEEQVNYPMEALTENPNPPPVDSDTTAATRAELNLPAPPATECVCTSPGEDDGNGFCSVCGGELAA